MKKDTIAWSVAGVIIVAAIIVVIVVSAHHKQPVAPITDTGSSPAVGTATGTGSTQTGSGAVTQSNGSTIVKTTPTNTEVNYQSDLEAFSIVPGTHILNEITATGTIDPSYASNGKVTIELTDQHYKTSKMITGYVTGSDVKGNVKFTADINTSGITKGVAYLIFRQVSGNHYVSLPIVAD